MIATVSASGEFQETVVDDILASCSTTRRSGDQSKPYFVAIDGRSASGKSTLGRQLAKRPGVTVIEMDDFYRVDDPVERAALTPVQGIDRYFDWERVRDEALVPLSEGREANYATYDWDNNVYGPAKTAKPTDVIVVEGVYSAHPRLSAYFDFVVLVDTPVEASYARQDARGQDAKDWIARWRAAESVYFDARQFSIPDLTVDRA